MAYTLSNKCAKRTVLVQLIIKKVVTCFLEQSVYIVFTECALPAKRIKSVGHC